MTDAPASGPSGPDFVVAGAGRAGTTAIMDALSSHRRIFVTTPKEPHFLAHAGGFTPYTGPGDDVMMNQTVITDEARYRALFTDAGDRVKGEGSVSTLYLHAAAAPRLKALNPDARVIVMLRNPVERANSAYQYLVARGWETAPSLVEAAQQEDDRVAQGWHHLWHYRRMSCYADALAALREQFGPDQVGVWFYEDFAVRGPEVVEEMLGFLSVPIDDAEPVRLREVNVSGTVRSKLVQHAVQVAGQHPRLKKALSVPFPFYVRERIRRMNLRAARAPAPAYGYFGEAFDADGHELQRLLGRVLPW